MLSSYSVCFVMIMLSGAQSVYRLKCRCSYRVIPYYRCIVYDISPSNSMLYIRYFHYPQSICVLIF